MELLKTIKKAAETQFNESGSRILFQRRKKIKMWLLQGLFLLHWILVRKKTSVLLLFA